MRRYSSGERTRILNEREQKRQIERAAAVAAGNLKGAPPTTAAEERQSQAQYVKGVTSWNFNMDELKAEAAAMVGRCRLTLSNPR